jgi:hypothetical protein
MSGSIVLRHIMLLQRDVPQAAKYYGEGLGLTVRVVTEKWAELDAGGATIALKHAGGFVTISCCSLCLPVQCCSHPLRLNVHLSCGHDLHYHHVQGGVRDHGILAILSIHGD